MCLNVSIEVTGTKFTSDPLKFLAPPCCLDYVIGSVDQRVKMSLLRSIGLRRNGLNLVSSFNMSPTYLAY